MPQEDNWLPQDAVTTREYLNSPTGQKLLSILFKTAAMENGETIEQEALNSRETKGGLKIVNAMMTHAQDQPEQTGTMQFYPSNV